jgi:hypothetical protein
MFVVIIIIISSSSITAIIAIIIMYPRVDANQSHPFPATLFGVKKS